MRERLEHDLSILVELDLYTRIRAIRDGSFPDEEKMVKQTVKSFEDGLPEYLKQIPNCHSIIVETLKRVEEEMKRIEKMRQEAVKAE